MKERLFYGALPDPWTRVPSPIHFLLSKTFLTPPWLVQLVTRHDLSPGPSPLSRWRAIIVHVLVTSEAPNIFRFVIYPFFKFLRSFIARKLCLPYSSQEYVSLI